MNEHPSLQEQIATKCRHFNGIHNRVCNAGITYKDVEHPTARPLRLPCFIDEGCTERCTFASFPSPEEATSEAQEQEKVIATFIAELTEGKTCPHCHTPIESRYQVGRCVYARPCMCRQYQGTLPKSERTAEPPDDMDLFHDNDEVDDYDEEVQS